LRFSGDLHRPRARGSHVADEDGLLQGGEGFRAFGANFWPTKPLYPVATVFIAGGTLHIGGYDGNLYAFAVGR
jgi:hypothetical protein